MNNYAESTDKQTGRKSYIRTSSRTGEAVTLENISISGDIAKALKFAVSVFYTTDLKITGVVSRHKWSTQQIKGALVS